MQHISQILPQVFECNFIEKKNGARPITIKLLAKDADHAERLAKEQEEKLNARLRSIYKIGAYQKSTVTNPFI